MKICRLAVRPSSHSSLYRRMGRMDEWVRSSSGTNRDELGTNGRMDENS